MLRSKLAALVTATILGISAGCAKKAQDTAPAPSAHAAEPVAAPSAAAPTGVEKPPSSNALAAAGKRGTLSISPTPVPTCEKTSLGEATIAWSASGVDVVEVRVNGPNDALLARTEAKGGKKTAPWIQKGTVFYLQDGSEGVPRDLDHTLAKLEVETVAGACK